MQLSTITVANANLGGDPEQRQTPNGATVVTFTCAVNHKQGQSEFVNWFRVSAFGRLGETLMGLHQRGYLVKGRSVYVQGRFSAREYTDKQGNQRTSLDITASDVLLLGSGDNDSDGDDNAVPF